MIFDDLDDSESATFASTESVTTTRRLTDGPPMIGVRLLGETSVSVSGRLR